MCNIYYIRVCDKARACQALVLKFWAPPQHTQQIGEFARRTRRGKRRGRLSPSIFRLCAIIRIDRSCLLSKKKKNLLKFRAPGPAKRSRRGDANDSRLIYSSVIFIPTPSLLYYAPLSRARPLAPAHVCVPRNPGESIKNFIFPHHRGNRKIYLHRSELQLLLLYTVRVFICFQEFRCDDMWEDCVFVAI